MKYFKADIWTVRERAIYANGRYQKKTKNKKRRKAEKEPQHFHEREIPDDEEDIKNIFSITESIVEKSFPLALNEI